MSTARSTVAPASRRGRRRLTRTRVIAVGAATVALVAIGTGAVFATTGSSTDYRTAVAQLGSVDETLSVSGTIASATRRDLAFGVAGTVDTVGVEVGDTVAAGDTLATVATDDLQDAVDAAADRVAQAEQTLASDLDSQTSSTTSGTSASTGVSTGSTGATGGSGAGSGSAAASGVSEAESAAIAQVTTAQQDLLALVDAASASLVASQEATATSTTICAPFLAATLPDAATDADPTSAATDGSAADPAATDPADDPTAIDPSAALTATQQLLVACQAAITGVGSAQAVTDAAQAGVVTSMGALDDAIAALQTALAATTPSATATTPAITTPAASGSTATPSTSAAGSAASAAGGATASAADIVADRAAIAAAEAQVLIAQQQLAGAALTSPIAGTVAQVALAVGDTLTAASTTAVITVIGDDGYVIESTVSLSQIAKVEVGQTATLTLAASGATYDATVGSVGMVDVSETSTPSYAITIAVDPEGDVLLNGAAATADIAVSGGEGVLTVPLSALHSGTTGDTVDVLSGGVITVTPVEVGAVGTDAVEIASGLAVGDVVVIADLGAEIATDETTTDTGLTGLSGDTAQQGGPVGGFTGTPPEGFTPPN